MKICDINPFMRYAELQPSVMSSAPLSCSYDHRIFYILEGEAELVFSDRTVPLSAGMLIYFCPAIPYYFDGKVKVIVLNFDMTRAQSNKKTPRAPSKSIEDFDEDQVFEKEIPEELDKIVIIDKAFGVENKMRECLLHYCYPTAFSDAITSALIKYIVCYIAQKSAHKETKLPELVQKITLYIQQNYDKDISNSQISRELGYHSFYLNRVFKKTMGITIHQAVIQEKIRVAKHLLKETELSIAAVASEVGFSDRSQFCTVFRKYTNYTPTEYRSRKTNAK